MPLNCTRRPYHRHLSLIQDMVLSMVEWARLSHYAWSSVCTYEHNLQSEWIRVTIHRAQLEWARFSHYDNQCVPHEHKLTGWVNPSHRPQGMVGISQVLTLWSSVCTYECNLQSEWIQVTVHRAWLEWARFSHNHQCIHAYKHNLHAE